MGGVAWLERGKVECGSESVVGGMDGDGTGRRQRLSFATLTILSTCRIGGKLTCIWHVDRKKGKKRRERTRHVNTLPFAGRALAAGNSCRTSTRVVKHVTCTAS
jgi:hypothetical protein